MGEKRMAEVDDPIFSVEQPVFFPFGPPVYVDKVLPEFVEELDNLIEEHGGKIEFDASGLLAGRIRKFEWKLGVNTAKGIDIIKPF